MVDCPQLCSLLVRWHIVAFALVEATGGRALVKSRIRSIFCVSVLDLYLRMAMRGRMLRAWIKKNVQVLE